MVECLEEAVPEKQSDTKCRHIRSKGSMTKQPLSFFFSESQIVLAVSKAKVQAGYPLQQDNASVPKECFSAICHTAAETTP